MRRGPVQYFTPEYLEYCRSLTTEQICRFVEDFRTMVFATSSSAPDASEDALHREPLHGDESGRIDR